MHVESTQAALGVILVVLASAALAAQRRAQQDRDAYAQAVAANESGPHGAGAGDGSSPTSEASTAASEASVPALRALLEPAVAPPSAASALREGRRMDLNRASLADLVLLPRVGPKLAQRIVDDRARRGRYSHLDQLLDVRGMGPKTLALVRPLLEVTADRSGTTATRPP